MMGVDKRLKDLEREVQPKEPDKISVDWDPDPGPEETGVKYIYWDEDEED